MCGIAGIFHLETAKPVDPARLKKMADRLAHRGPDGSGIWTAPGVGLGHRRLSIIDIEGSPQPMLTADEALVISFNGEIYNFQEVRAKLETKGHVFRTEGDTEVILYAYKQWGVDCLKHLNGMFAFAIFDQRTKQLFLARDRLGVKPLFYAPVSDGSVIFGSELKALLANPLLRREPELRAVDDYLAFGYVPDTISLLKGVKKLPAGHYLLLEQGKPEPQSVQYWDMDFSQRSKASAGELEEELVALMKEAVSLRMIADVPLGAFLSGGVDSSAVVALMSEKSRQPVKTCSIGFDQASLDETGYAERIAQRFKTDHRSRTVAADDFGLIDTLTDHFDEPFADGSALPTYRVCELARQNVTVALSGDGADEALAGYRRHVFHNAEEQVRGRIPQFIRGPALGWLGSVYPKADWAPRPFRAKSTLLSLARTGPEGYAEAVGVTTPAGRTTIYSDEMVAKLGGYKGESQMIDLMESAPAQNGLDQAQYADMKMWLPGDILTKVDRTSMAVSLEAREPLLDYKLMEFAAKLPTNLRVRKGQGKYLLKKSMERYLPEDILYRPKMGFVTPIAQWFRGPLAEEARGIAKAGALARMGWFDPQALSKVADDHIAGKSDNSRLLWQLLILDKSLVRLFNL
ncbi:XrtA/PEP-CTERM system amidotransferase [Parasphingorhabdus halotolerans]|uniref:asparagine synthase (glutamine-hydrolyzing) n=1 Tax=Parasphingorhabdus halotolerans TaxID=2725558 RepID=A0A6H2DIE2_9SPHN|nr:XrtA/PEP-CTERM system amidotransferase [Parasphingorhabdus halotolerans]QJB68439.1 amidotransferase 1, exosortase A system-associated [Parasphingorhabdus halotolerans]